MGLHIQLQIDIAVLKSETAENKAALNSEIQKLNQTIQGLTNFRMNENLKQKLTLMKKEIADATKCNVGLGNKVPQLQEDLKQLEQRLKQDLQQLEQRLKQAGKK